MTVQIEKEVDTVFDFDEDVIGIALRFYQNLIPMIVGIK